MRRGSFFDKVISLIYPDSCPYCGKIVGNTDVRCADCQKSVKNAFSVLKITDGVSCVSPFRYEGKVRHAIHKFKFRGYKRYGWNFAVEIVKSLKINFPGQKFSAVTSVPLNKKDIKIRGYNQAEVLAKEIGNFLDIPDKEILEKVKNNNPQHQIEDYSERIINVKDVYKVKYRCNTQGERLLLCDDIVTSGSTLKECVNVLKDAGFRDILCVTVANAQRLKTVYK